MGTSDGLIAVTASTISTGLSYRRNGKLFSCEPCRKGKLRCDHTTPICDRCARRGKSDQCTYHPAPLTKPRTLQDLETSAVPAPARFNPYPSPRTQTSSQGLVSPPLARNLPQDQISAHHESMDQVTDLSSTSQFGEPTITSPQFLPLQDERVASSSHFRPLREERVASSVSATITTLESSMSYRDSKAGFLGATAFTAVFTEHSESTGFEELGTGIEIGELPPIAPEKIQQGAEVLAALRDMPFYRKFTDRWFDLYDGMVILQPAFRIWFDDLWEEWQHILTNGSQTQLLKLSELVFHNTRQPWRTNSKTGAVEWSKAATGKNIRWEVVGMILSLVGLVAVNLNDWDAIFDDMRGTFIDRETFAEQMRKLSEQCLCFCYECEVLNDMYLCFLYQDLVLVECTKGEAHYATWQRTGELLDTVVAMGLHQGNYIDCETPFWLSELRRRLFVSSYSRDKAIATFLGRPPRLSYRYCKLEMPVDLNDDELFMEGADLDAAKSMLDENGWNTSARLSRRTWTRVWFQECLIREEILEIALGSGDEDLDDRASKIRAKLSRTHQDFPPCIQMSVDDILEETTLTTANRCDRIVGQINALYVVCVNCGLLLTEFLLQRAVVNRSKGDTKTLIPVARKLLHTVLLAHTRKDFFRDFRGDIVYLLAFYGLPSAGMLAIELLKQEQSRQYAPDLLPRSETIQDLSVFISALAGVSRGEGNYNICNQGRRALKRVLDQVLAPPAPAGQTEQAPTDDMSMYFPLGNDADFLQWLDNVDWDKSMHNQPFGKEVNTG